MYVMTPFTSLLVLENEDLYKQYKVDRGRKDHWAMYPALAKIPAVYEPDPDQPDPKLLKSGQRLPARQVLRTIALRQQPGLVGVASGGEGRIERLRKQLVDLADRDGAIFLDAANMAVNGARGRVDEQRARLDRLTQLRRA